MPDKPQTLMGMPIVFVDDFPPMPEIVLVDISEVAQTSPEITALARVAIATTNLARAVHADLPKEEIAHLRLLFEDSFSQWKREFADM